MQDSTSFLVTVLADYVNSVFCCNKQTTRYPKKMLQNGPRTLFPFCNGCGVKLQLQHLHHGKGVSNMLYEVIVIGQTHIHNVERLSKMHIR